MPKLSEKDIKFRAKLLNNLWAHFDREILKSNHNKVRKNYIQSKWASTYELNRFKDWLWEQGLCVRQENKVRYLDGDDKRLCLISIQWSE